MLVDAQGRAVRSLRISVTERCNLRCVYCLPATGTARGSARPVGRAALVLAARVAVELGVRRLRVTGGEPLLWPELPALIAELAGLPEVEDLALTTNGVLLADKAEALAAAGLRRVNVSLDGLDGETFVRMARRGGLARAEAGIAAALAAGLGPVRLNVVVLRGLNDHTLDAWVERTTQAPVEVRFLELMPIGEGRHPWAEGRYVDLTAAAQELTARWGLVPEAVGQGNGPATYLRVPGAPGRVGFITPLSAPYCDRCSRLRLTSTGQVRACLADDAEVDLAAALVAGDAAAVAEGLRRAVAAKPAGHRWREGAVTHTGMAHLGG